MRGIKFRGKANIKHKFSNNSWAKGYLFKNEHSNECFIFAMGDIAQVIPETVGQCTGVKDKNGVEIYEGDLVIYGNWKVKEVVFGDIGSSFSLKESLYIFYDKDSKDLEVVGNIHDR